MYMFAIAITIGCFTGFSTNLAYSSESHQPSVVLIQGGTGAGAGRAVVDGVLLRGGEGARPPQASWRAAVDRLIQRRKQISDHIHGILPPKISAM